MVKKVLGIIAIVGGGVLFVLSLIVDLIWVRAYPGFNSVQIYGLILGLFGILIGVLLTIKLKKKPNKAE